MLPSVTSFIRASDSQVCKNILAHAQQKAAAIAEETKDEKMETESGASEEKEKAESSLCLFEIDNAEVSQWARRKQWSSPLTLEALWYWCFCP